MRSARGVGRAVAPLPNSVANGTTSLGFTETSMDSGDPGGALDMAIGAFTETNLDKQGFQELDAEAKSRYALPLRFTPGVSTALVVIGLVLRSPVVFPSTAS